MAVQEKARKLYREASETADADEAAALKLEAIDLVIAASDHDAVFRPIPISGDAQAISWDGIVNPPTR